MRKMRTTKERSNTSREARLDEEKHRETDSEVEDKEQVRMAPDMGAGGLHPQVKTDPEEKQQRQEGQYNEPRQWVLRQAREWSNEWTPS